MPLLSIDGLRRSGLGPLSFEINAGECLALTGPSGAGKTLLLRALADLDPNEGQVRLDGRERAVFPAPDWRRRLSYVPAEAGWWQDQVGPHFPDQSRARELLSQLGFEDAAEVLAWPVSQLSSGERQRLALARGLIGRAQILLLDEPTSALDEDNRDLVETLLRSRLDDNVAILLVSHDRHQIERLADRVLGLENGQLVAAP